MSTADPSVSTWLLVQSTNSSSPSTSLRFITGNQKKMNSSSFPNMIGTAYNTVQ